MWPALFEDVALDIDECIEKFPPEDALTTSLTINGATYLAGFRKLENLKIAYLPLTVYNIPKCYSCRKVTFVIYAHEDQQKITSSYEEYFPNAEFEFESIREYKRERYDFPSF